MKTQEITLKKILENADLIPTNGKPPGFGDEQPKLTKEQKKKLMTMVAEYSKLGESLRDCEKIVTTSKSLSEIAEMAGQYAMTEAGDCFQENIIRKDFDRVKKDAKSFEKIAKETYAKLLEMNALYDDIGKSLQRYYEINESVNTPL